jgi:hypothetical protein
VPRKENVHTATLGARVLQGAGLGAAIAVLRFMVGFGAELQTGQIIVGLLAVAIGGGFGGVVYYATDALRCKGSAGRTIANVVSLLVYCLVTIACLMLVFGTS